jgi:hypothetical protein
MRKLFLTMAILLSACTKEKLDPIKKLYLSSLDYVRVEAQFCNSPPTISKQKVKYLFVLDKSDSNQPGFTVVPGDINNTDPTGSRRYGPMVQFLRDLPNDPNQLTSFSLINFNDNASLPRERNFVNGFDTDRTNFQSVVKSQWIGSGSAAAPMPDDRGFTNYVSVLQQALSMIRSDAQYEAGSIERPIVTTAYRIIFVSDGSPRVPSGAGVYAQTFATDIQPVINSLLSLKDDPVVGPFIGDIVLNTAYYFLDTQDIDAAALLEQMANAGNGQFMKFGAGENVIYGAFAPPVRNVKQILSDIFVENLTTSWWDDGRFLLDSDGDGLPEAIEDSVGADPRNRDTDGNGVSDLVEYRTKGKPCEGAGCNRSLRNPYSVCDGFRPVTDAAGNVAFPDTDRDGLNDCEEFLLKSDRTRVDSNGDFIPDAIAFKAGVPFIAGTDGSYAQPQGDGLTSYMKIKLGLPIQLPRERVKDYLTRSTTLDKLADRLPDGRECFRLAVDPVAVLGPNNVIRVYLSENTSVIDDKPKVRIAERLVTGGMSKIVFSDGEFQ